MAFTWQGRQHRFTSVDKRWRVHEGWWQDEVWREYWKVTTETGLLCIIYQSIKTCSVEIGFWNGSMTEPSDVR